MKSNWKTLTLGDVTTWSSGGTPKKSEPSFWNGDISWISASSMDGHLYTDSRLKITLDGLNNGSRLAPEGSILLLVRGSILHQKIQVDLTTKPVAFNQDVKCLIANEALVDPWYLLLWFKAKEQELLSIVESTGIGAGKFDTKLLLNYPIEIPPKEERDRIRTIGKALFDKTTLNQQTNQTLEQMAQALFKSWFVDFDPVIDNALAAGTNISDFPEPLQKRAELRKTVQQSADAKKLPEGLSQETRKLFPSEFEESELGWVPKGWEVKSLADVTTQLRRGISPKYLEEGGIQVINQKCIRNHEVNYDLCRRNNPELRKIDGRELQLGDLLINSTGVGTLGRMAQVRYLDELTVVDSHVTVVRADAQRYPIYTFGQMMLSLERQIEALGEGSTGQTELSRKTVSKLPVILPSNKSMKFMEENLVDISKKTISNIKQTKEVTKLRDTILPKLISGDISLDY